MTIKEQHEQFITIYSYVLHFLDLISTLRNRCCSFTLESLYKMSVQQSKEHEVLSIRRSCEIRRMIRIVERSKKKHVTHFTFGSSTDVLVVQTRTLEDIHVLHRIVRMMIGH